MKDGTSNVRIEIAEPPCVLGARGVRREVLSTINETREIGRLPLFLPKVFQPDEISSLLLGAKYRI